MAEEQEEDASGAGSPVMPAIAYPSHILFVPIKAFFANFGVWTAVMLLTFQPVLFLAGWAPCHLILTIFYYRDPYFPDVIIAWWKSGLWPRSRRTKNLYSTKGNRYLP